MFQKANCKRYWGLLPWISFWFPAARGLELGDLFTAAAFKLAAVRGTGLSNFVALMSVGRAFAGAERIEAAVVLLGALGNLSDRHFATLNVDLPEFTL